MIYLLYTIHILVCVFLILVVLLQQGKGADLSVFGGGSTQAAFGSRGATTFLHKLTVVSFIVFVLTTLAIGIPQFAGTASVLKGAQAGDKAPGAAGKTPAKPGAAAAGKAAPAPVAPAPGQKPAAAPAPAAPGTAGAAAKAPQTAPATATPAAAPAKVPPPASNQGSGKTPPAPAPAH